MDRETRENQAISEAHASMQETSRNGAGIETAKLRQSTGRPKGARNLNAKHPSSLARRLKDHGIDWTLCLARSIKAYGDKALSKAERLRAREDIKIWMKALPYMVTTVNKVRVKRWKGKASKAALVALDALEGR